MSWFKCFILGENFPGELIGENGLIGFYTTRFVESENKDSAETIALNLLRNDPKFATITATQTSAKPMVYFEDISEVTPDQIPNPQPGFAFYLIQPVDA